jgi:hypothetical protein
MTGVIDGSYDTPEGQKLFVSLRPGESSDEFVTRAMGFMVAMSDNHALDKVLATTPEEWEIIPIGRWVEAVNRSEPRLRLRLTDLSSSDGGSVGHLVVDCEGDPIADDWGDLQEEAVYLPRARYGRVRTWQATLWSLVHQIRGLGDQYDAALERSGIVVERGT